MTFENLESNFEQKAKEGPQQQLSPEEQHLRNKQTSVEKEKYQETMKSTIQNGILGVFQSKLESLRKNPTSGADTFDTIHVTSEDIQLGKQPSATQEVSEEQIQDLIGKNTKEVKTEVNPTPIESQIEKSSNIEIVSEKNKTISTAEVEETISKVTPKRYIEDENIIDNRASHEDSISQIAVLRAANGQPTHLGSDGKEIHDDVVMQHIEKHRELKRLRKEAEESGESLDTLEKPSSETILSFEEPQLTKEEKEELEKGPSETPLEESDIF